MRLSLVGLAIVVPQLGCSDSATCAIGEDIQLASIEEGGICKGPGPCWLRTTVMPPAAIILESPEMRMTAQLSTVEADMLFGLFKTQDFCSALESPNTCAVTFETSTILTVETSDASYIDSKAGDCIFGGEMPHPYVNFYRQLDKIRRAHFPGVLK